MPKITVDDIVPIQLKLEEASNDLYEAIGLIAAKKIAPQAMRGIIETVGTIQLISEELLKAAEVSRAQGNIYSSYSSSMNNPYAASSGIRGLPVSGAARLEDVARNISQQEFVARLRETPTRPLTVDDLIGNRNSQPVEQPRELRQAREMTSEEITELIEQLKKTPGVVVPDTEGGAVALGTTESLGYPPAEQTPADENLPKYPQGQE